MSKRWPELVDEYERLRGQLEAAYAAPVWDSGRIDRIVDAIAPIERALGAGRYGGTNWRLRSAGAAAPHSPESGAGGWSARAVAGSARRGLAAAVEAVASAAAPGGARRVA
jgi:hypothetical protein